MNSPDLVDAITLQLDRWKLSPRNYCRDVLGIPKLWKLQDQLLDCLPDAIKERKSIYVASGHSLGKDYICAAIALWFLQCFRPSNVILTGPTDRQVKNIQWKETLGHWNNKKHNLGGKAFVEPFIKISDDWFLMGFTTAGMGASKESGGRFQGLHAPAVCVIVTEAQAVEDTIYDEIDAITTPENVLVIYIGNPTRARGRFAAGLRDSKRNKVFHFSCLENPNYLERKTVIPGLASYEWVEAMREKWGEGDPRWVGRVLGRVPDAAMNSIFPQDVIDHALERYGFIASHSDNRGVAVDPAGEGVDDNVFYSGSGGEVMDTFTKTLMSPSDSAHKAVEMCKKINGNFIIVDCDGLGIGVYQHLKGLAPSFLQGISILKFHGSGKTTVPEGARPIYENMRCEAAFTARDRIKRGEASIFHRDVELLEDLREDVHFENAKTGLLQIIPKEEIKEVLGRSPGRGDCWKMLQWAFEKNVKPNVYEKERTPSQQYAISDEGFAPGGQQYAKFD